LVFQPSYHNILDIYLLFSYCIGWNLKSAMNSIYLT
jgi:hypothetical protein